MVVSWDSSSHSRKWLVFTGDRDIEFQIVHSKLRLQRAISMPISDLFAQGAGWSLLVSSARSTLVARSGFLDWCVAYRYWNSCRCGRSWRKSYHLQLEAAFLVLFINRVSWLALVVWRVWSNLLVGWLVGFEAPWVPCNNKNRKVFPSRVGWRIRFWE